MIEKINLDDNLLIKGNNLLALYSLLPIYKGKVKLIYIDPPYNTGNDGFKYNDTFNHSTWLTFMKNRLEVARQLLAEDGVIFVQIDDNEQAYLKVLMDEVFCPNDPERKNFINTICIQSSTPSGVKTTHKEKTIIKTKDTILLYAKNSQHIVIKPQYFKQKEWDSHYNYFVDLKTLQIQKLKDVLINHNINNLDIDDKKFREFYLTYKDNIFQTGKEMPEEIRELSKKEENKDIIIEYIDKNNNKQFAYNGRRLSSLSKSINYVLTLNTQEISKLLCDIWIDIDFNNTQNEGGVSLQAGKKPEALLQRIIDMTTKEGDLVLDFFAGSGTTAAVAHKMNRRWIAIEQMDYVETITRVRLEKVLAGEQGGVSKNHNWQGGGGFAYFVM